MRADRGGEKENKNVQMETGNIIEKLAICSGDKSIALMRNESYAFALHPQNKPFVCEKDPPWSFYK